MSPAAGAAPPGGNGEASPVRAPSYPRNPADFDPLIAQVRHPLSVHPLTPGRLQRNRRRRANPNPSSPANLLFKTLFHLKTPVQNAKNASPSPRFAGPAPTAATWIPDAFGQYPGGSRSEDDPCLGLRRLRTGGALASSLSGICATRSIPLSVIWPDFFVIP